MALPLLAMVIVLTFFFGYTMINQQHVIAASRHVAWKAAYTGGQTPSFEELSEGFYENKADSGDVSLGSGPIETQRRLIRYVEEQGNVPATELIEICLDPTWPRGRDAKVRANFTTSIRAWQKLVGPRDHQHVREGLEWLRTPPVGPSEYYRQASYLEPIRDQFLPALDNAIKEIGDPQLREALISLYSQRW